MPNTLLATKGLAFPGFDGNDHTEVRYLGFVRHAVEKRNLFTGLKSDSSDYNSHFPTLNSYRVRLERWKNMMTRYLDFGPSTLCPAA